MAERVNGNDQTLVQFWQEAPFLENRRNNKILRFFSSLFALFNVNFESDEEFMVGTSGSDDAK